MRRKSSNFAKIFFFLLFFGAWPVAARAPAAAPLQDLVNAKQEAESKGYTFFSSREEIIGSTAVVLMTMLILSTFIGISDFILSRALSVLLR